MRKIVIAASPQSLHRQDTDNVLHICRQGPNLYSVKIVIYKGPKWPEKPKPSGFEIEGRAARPNRRHGVRASNEPRGSPDSIAMPHTIMAGCAMPCSKRPSGCSSEMGLEG